MYFESKSIIKASPNPILRFGIDLTPAIIGISITASPEIVGSLSPGL